MSTIAVSLLFERLGFAAIDRPVHAGDDALGRAAKLAVDDRHDACHPIVLYLGFARILMVPIPFAPPGF